MVIVVKMARLVLLVQLFVVSASAPQRLLRLLTREIAAILAIIVV